jgi:hypothetical protein
LARHGGDDGLASQAQLKQPDRSEGLFLKSLKVTAEISSLQQVPL